MKRTTTRRPKWRVITSYVMAWPVSETQFKRGNEPRKVFTYIVITLLIAALTVLFWKIENIFTLVNVALLYLLPVFIAAIRWGLWPSFYAAVMGVIAFDFFFVPPLYTYTVSDARYLISFAVYLAVATFTASLASQLRERFREARERERVTSSLFSLSTQVAASGDLDSILSAIARQSYVTFGLSTTVLLPNAKGHLNARASYGFQEGPDAYHVEPRIAQWVYDHGEMAGYGTRAYNETSVLYVPLKTDANTHGVMCFVDKAHTGIGGASSRLRVVHALGALAAVSIARVRFQQEAQLAQLTVESERLRTALLDSISHELRTPLATIIGSATALMETGDVLSKGDRRQLLETVREGSMRMNRLVTNLLGMVRLESGMLRLHKDWCDVSDLVGVALRQLQDSLQNREVMVNIPDNLPAVSVDDGLMEQVIVNLVSNAVKYSPAGSPIQIDALEYDGILTLRVRDYGTGIDSQDAAQIFDKFYRSSGQKSIPGTGLGLAICKGIVQAHDGEIFARNAEDKGLLVTIRIPIGETQENLND